MSLKRWFKNTSAGRFLYGIHETSENVRNIRQQTALNGLLYYSHQALNSSTPGLNASKRATPLVISLTTYGQRVHDVYLTIESLMQQTVKADKLILWLSEEEFSQEDLPEILKRQQARGLTIGFCKDTKSYKKLIPTLVEHANDVIITVDDDIIYPIDHIERLYTQYLKFPTTIHCHRAHRVTFDNQGLPLNYLSWEHESTHPEASLSIFPTGCGGILYPPGCFAEEISREDLFMELCPNTDDVWFKLMGAKKGTKSKLVPNARPWNQYFLIPDTQENSLWNENMDRNDDQLAKGLAAFPTIQLKE